MKIHKLAHLEKACSSDKHRVALAHPYIDRSEPGAPVAVATNGKIMAVVPVSELADGEHSFVPCSVLKAARKLDRNADHSRISFQDWKGENLRMFALSNGATMPDEIQKGQTFCQWRQVSPQSRPDALRVSFNPALLLALAEAMAAGEGVTLEIAADSGAILVRPSFYSNGSGRAFGSCYSGRVWRAHVHQRRRREQTGGSAGSGHCLTTPGKGPFGTLASGGNAET